MPFLSGPGLPMHRSDTDLTKSISQQNVQSLASNAAHDG
jgi:hypothetical protein